MGILLFLGMSNFNYRRLWDVTYVIYGMAVFLLLLVYVLGIVRLGAQRWLRFGGFNFQPSEMAKLVMTIFLARYFSRKSADDASLSVNRFGIVRGLLLPLFFVIIPVGLIIEQPDLGSGILVLCLFFAMLFLSGVKLRYILLVVVSAGVCVPVVWHFLREYQKERLMVFLNPNIDPLGAGYTVIQSKIAIGSGKFLGKGWLLGTQSQLHFLPESHTDFIFATFAEEWGFVGCAVLLCLYAYLIIKGIAIASTTGDHFGRLLASGISLMLAIQVFVNIAMNLGLAPVVGVPLPLMSYGGSSLFVTFISLGILVNIDRKRAVF
jgi:rod shape determining protein RodA